MATTKAAAARTSPAWSFLIASLFALLVGTGVFVYQQYQFKGQSDANSKVLGPQAAAAAAQTADQISSEPDTASSTTATTAPTESQNPSSSSSQEEHDNYPDSSLPAQLQGVPFNVTLDCWHIRADSRAADATFHVAAQADFEPGQRWEEAQDAISRTRTSNPGVHYILVTQTLGVIELAAEGLKGARYDLWYCPQVLYGTPIQIGNLYAGTKFAVSVDDWFPPWDWQCSFKNGTHSFVYVVQRQDQKKLSGYDRTCEETIRRGGADGFLFDYIPEDAVDELRYVLGGRSRSGARFASPWCCFMSE